MESINPALEESVPPSPCQVHVSPQQEKQPDALVSALEMPRTSPPASPDGCELPSPDLQGLRSTAGEGLLASQVDASPQNLPELNVPAAESAGNDEQECPQVPTAASSPGCEATEKRQHHRKSLSQTAAANSRPSPIRGSAVYPKSAVHQARPSEQHPAADHICLRKQPELNMAIAPPAAASLSPGSQIARKRMADTEGPPAQPAGCLPGLTSPHPDQLSQPRDSAISPESHSQMSLPIADTPAADELGPLDDDCFSPSWQPSPKREGIVKAASKQPSAQPG